MRSIIFALAGAVTIIMLLAIALPAALSAEAEEFRVPAKLPGLDQVQVSTHPGDEPRGPLNPEWLEQRCLSGDKGSPFDQSTKGDKSAPAKPKEQKGNLGRLKFCNDVCRRAIPSPPCTMCVARLPRYPLGSFLMQHLYPHA